MNKKQQAIIKAKYNQFIASVRLMILSVLALSVYVAFGHNSMLISMFFVLSIISAFKIIIAMTSFEQTLFLGTE